VYDHHIQSTQHVLKVDGAGRVYECEVCGVKRIQSAHDFRRHVASKKHKAKVAALIG